MVVGLLPVCLMQAPGGHKFSRNERYEEKGKIHMARLEIQ